MELQSDTKIVPRVGFLGTIYLYTGNQGVKNIVTQFDLYSVKRKSFREKLSTK